MVLGLGADIVHLPDFSARLEDLFFLAETFSAAERSYCEALPSPARRLQSFAARFAAKEAVIKAIDAARVALPVPARFDADWKDLEVVLHPYGVPQLHAHGRWPAILEALGVTRVHLSLSHDGPFAQAVVILEG